VVEEIRAGGGTAIGVPGAVNEPQFAEELIHRCVEAYGGIDILINNAAIYSTESVGPVLDCSLEMWHRTLNVNLDSVFYTCRAALPYMVRQRWGRIINAGSFAGTGKMGGGAYCASKSALFGLTRGMAADYGPYGITCNVYNPEAQSTMGDTYDPKILRAILDFWLERGFRSSAENAYLSGLCGPEGTAPWVAYLCTDEAEYLNGRVMAVEGRRMALLAQPEEQHMLFQDYSKDGPISLDQLCLMAPLAFPVTNAWPRRTGDALKRWESSRHPGSAAAKPS